MRRTPQEGGIMHGGPLAGRRMAYGGPVMPMYDSTGLIIGMYFWDEDHWEYETEESVNGVQNVNG